MTQSGQTDEAPEMNSFIRLHDGSQFVCQVDERDG